MNKGMAIIVAGSREFNNYQLLQDVCDMQTKDRDDVTIISGGARGADKLGEDYSIERGFKLLRIEAEWNEYGKSAGYRRNCDMAITANSYIDRMCIAFSVNKSKGTNHMINICKRYNVPCLKVELTDDSPTGVVATYYKNKPE